MYLKIRILILNMKISLLIQEICCKTHIFHMDIDNRFTFLDLLKSLLDKEKIKTEIHFDFSSFKRNIDKQMISLSNVNEKVIEYLEEINNEKILILFHFNIFSYKNDFHKTKNIVGLYKNGLEKTSNIGDSEDKIDIINHGKIGEWIGFGKGPTSVDKCEDNRLVNLIFVKYKNSNPIAYNIHCLLKLINGITILIPHLNIKFYSIKLLQQSLGNDEFKILNLDDSDIIHQLSFFS